MITELISLVKRNGGAPNVPTSIRATPRSSPERALCGVDQSNPQGLNVIVEAAGFVPMTSPQISQARAELADIIETAGQ